MASPGNGNGNGNGDEAGAAKRRKVGSTSTSFCDECLKLHIVHSAQDLEEEEGEGNEELMFDPEFSEKMFEDGKIHGYKGLKVDLWLHAATFHALVRMRYESKSAGPGACTDVVGKLRKDFGAGLTEDGASFAESLPARSREFEDLVNERGEVVAEWRADGPPGDGNGDGGELKRIVRMDLKDAAVCEWQRRLTPLTLLFIEAAKAIKDPEDPLWEIFVAIDGEGPRASVVGFCTVYRFYHYPDSTRLRISQILVLPPYQGRGFGLRLLQAVNEAATRRGCFDVTMEEPSITLQKLRDVMDVLRLLSLPSIPGAVEAAVAALHSKKATAENRASGGDQSGAIVNFNGSENGRKEKSALAPPAHLAEEVRRRFHVSKVQFRRCWEQLLFMFLDAQDKDLHDVFREAIVQRISVEIFQKENSGSARAGKRVIDTDNEYDNTKTFVMLRTRTRAGAAAVENGCAEEANDAERSVTPVAEEKAKVLGEELNEREDELQGVARAVARLARSMGLAVPPSFATWTAQEA